MSCMLLHVQNIWINRHKIFTTAKSIDAFESGRTVGVKITNIYEKIDGQSFQLHYFGHILYKVLVQCSIHPEYLCIAKAHVQPHVFRYLVLFSVHTHHYLQLCQSNQSDFHKTPLLHVGYASTVLDCTLHSDCSEMRIHQYIVYVHSCYIGNWLQWQLFRLHTIFVKCLCHYYFKIFIQGNINTIIILSINYHLVSSTFFFSGTQFINAYFFCDTMRIIFASC